MSYRINVEIYLSEVELSLIREHKINVPKICVLAVQEELSNHNSLKRALNGISTTDIRAKLEEAEAEIIKLRLSKAPTFVTIPVKYR